ncbi:hypothetical protein [Methyloversatilis sp.]|uniref:hypothetical protein n=1 Tax=Methyloversatilis sp. TaxID=2569862 RepID=UPI00273604A3|nr:hypothetical protein [Methyloversatilis sp.]MDP3454271.1 hypothetical protein [Methyloversatilis sp.]MDP3579698.1 hypothetical protein [Methyloversatilis sp.]
MIADLKPYAEYKESGLLWLGQVPGHWVTKRGKSYLATIDERSKTGREELLTVSSARGVVPRSSANVTMFKAESYAGHKLCWPGDLVINILWAWGGGLGVSQHHGIISTAYSVYRSRPSAQINPRFLHELVRSSAIHWELQVRSKGVWISRLQLTDTAFLDAPIPLPPPDEQVAIVRFLDWANGRLERAIRGKRKVIALLNEQKQAIIHRAVTRGLDPSVPLKPSGIPWLGDIPEHWELAHGVAVGRHFGKRARVEHGHAFLHRVARALTAVEADLFGQVFLHSGRAVGFGQTIDVGDAEADACHAFDQRRRGRCAGDRSRRTGSYLFKSTGEGWQSPMTACFASMSRAIRARRRSEARLMYRKASGQWYPGHLTDIGRATDSPGLTLKSALPDPCRAPKDASRPARQSAMR